MNSLQKKSARQVGDIIKDCLRIYGLAPKINRRLIDEAWIFASGASDYTKSTFYRNGIFYVTVTSSVIRSQLSFQKDVFKEKMNCYLSDNNLFDDKCTTAGFIKDIILK